MSPTDIRQLLQRYDAGELTNEQLVQAIEAVHDQEVEELRAELAQERAEEEARAYVRRARGYLADAVAADDDGGSNEAAVDAAAQEYCDAQDQLLRIRDPDAYHERRQMGLL